MFHQPYGLAIRYQNRLMVYRLMYKKKTTVRYGSTDQEPNLPPIIPLVKPCSSTALRSYPSAYPSRLGSVIYNHFNCGGMIFSLVFRFSRRFIFIPGKAPGTYRHRLYGLPRIPLPGHTRKIEFPKMMSSYKFSLCGSNLSFAGILFFLILFRRCSPLLYTQSQLASLSTDFIKQRAYELGHSCPYTDLDCQDCSQLNNCPMDAGTEEWFQLLVELSQRRTAK